MYKCKNVCVVVITIEPGEEICDEIYNRIEDRFKYKFEKIKQQSKKRKK